MLILPIVNKSRVMNVEIRLKGASKIRRHVHFDDAKESDIIVNREKFSDSSLYDSKDINAPINFIRSKSILYPRSFLVTTREEEGTSKYDVYAVDQPPKKVNDNLDKLYSKAIMDLKCEIPGRENRGRYVSFQDLGIDEHLQDDKIASLQRIIKEERDSSRWEKRFQEAGIMDLEDTALFFHNFECTLLEDTSIPVESLQDTIKTLSIINTRDYRNLKNYYRIAKSNTDIYTKISYINKIIYDRPLPLGRMDSKQLVKRREEGEYTKVA